MTKSIFGNNLMRLRKAKNLTRQALADNLNLPVTTVAGYETAGREPRFSTLIKISDYFGVSIDNLIRADVDDITLNLQEDNLTVKLPVDFKREKFRELLPMANLMLNWIKKAQDDDKTSITFSLPIAAEKLPTVQNEEGGRFN